MGIHPPSSSECFRLPLRRRRLCEGPDHGLPCDGGCADCRLSTRPIPTRRPAARPHGGASPQPLGLTWPAPGCRRTNLVEPWSCRAETKEKRPGLESRGPSARGAQRRVAERSEGMQRREHTQPRRDGRGRDATARERNAAIQHSLNGLRAPALCAVSNPSESSALPAGSRTSRRHRWTTQRSVLDTGHLVQETTQKGRLRLAARHSSRGGAVRRMMIMSRLLFLRADRLCDTCRSGTAHHGAGRSRMRAQRQSRTHSHPTILRREACVQARQPIPTCRILVMTPVSSP
jgi:hypothetical protein